MVEEKFTMKQFDREVLLGNATWWQMKLPSGDVIFGDAKPKMIGYPDSMFRHYTDFIKLVQPEDAEKAMQAMRDHLDGKVNMYETTYRIKHKNGEYIQFYDCGQITKREGADITVWGFVMKIKDGSNIIEQVKDFKKSIMEGKPSIIELVSKIR